jgi:UDP-N-acetylmuramate--alanine ligase
VVLDVYPAGEQPIASANGERLSESISFAGHKNVVYANSIDAGMEFMLREARPGDVVLAIGAGNVNRALDALAVKLDAKFAASHAN